MGITPQACHVSVVGNTAAGKTKIANELSIELGFDLYPEPKGTFNQKFHRDMDKWAFHNQVDYLVGTMQCEIQIGFTGRHSVQDRCSLEVIEVFSNILFHMGYLDEDELACLCNMFDNAKSIGLPEPSLFIYIFAPVEVLLDRLVQRNRIQDSYIERGMLRAFQSRYKTWIASLDKDRVLIWDNTDITTSDTNIRKLAHEVIKRLSVLR